MAGLSLRAWRCPPALLLAALLAACATPGELATPAGDAPAAPGLAAPRAARPPLSTPPPAAPGVGPAAVPELQATVPGPAAQPEAEAAADADPETWHGEASWYGPGLHGRRTASGERFDREALTAAHRELPFGTVVRVEHLDNGRSVDVRINDRGPFAKRHRNRIIDLSEAAARVLGLGRKAGVAPVRITIVQQDRP